MISSTKKSFAKSRKALMAVSAAGLLVCSTGAFASSHREAPNIAGNPRVDGTDLYAFQSYGTGAFVPGTTPRYTTIIANYNPSQNPGDGPNYYNFDPNAIYEIHVDNNGDGIEDKTFRFKFSQALAGSNGIGVTSLGQTVAIPLKYSSPIAAGATPPASLNFIETYTVDMTTNDRNTNDTRRTGTTVHLTDAANSNSTTFTKPLDNVGNKTIPNYDAYANQYKYMNVTIPGCSVGPAHMFVGQRKEGFAVNLNHVFDLVSVSTLAPASTGSPNANAVPVDHAAEPTDATNGGMPDTTNGITKTRNNDYLQVNNKNITSIAMEIPTACLTGETSPGTLTTAGTTDANHNGVIGLWTTASLPQAQLLNPNATFALPQAVGGAYTQVSRLGMPLVNELVIGLKDKDHFNASKPINDPQFLTYVTNPTLPVLLHNLFGVTPPTNTGRGDLVATFLTGITGVNALATVTPSEMLRLNTTIAPTASASQSNKGVIGNDLAGFPNGRRPGDEVVDISLRVVMGKLCTLTGATMPAGPIGGCTAGQAPNGNLDYTDGSLVDETDFDTSFPYLKSPNPGAQ